MHLADATPAKNSPLEYFSLLSLVDGEAWSRVGISDPEQFMNRYLRLEIRYVLGTGGQNELRAVVAGFRNIPELKDQLFRYAEFRTAEEVGLKLPKTEPKTIAVPMEEKQAELHGEMLQEYRTLMKSFSGSAAMKVGDRCSMVSWPAPELARAGIRVTAVAPLPITTMRLPA